jgi:uncharacterized glyoxalase superfamily protein PhnB
VLTRPDDLEDSVLTDAVRHGWGLATESLEYRPVGFGSHYWQATDSAGQRWFLTVDELDSKLLSSEDSHDAAFDRLTAALTAA